MTRFMQNISIGVLSLGLASGLAGCASSKTLNYRQPALDMTLGNFCHLAIMGPPFRPSGREVEGTLECHNFTPGVPGRRPSNARFALTVRRPELGVYDYYSVPFECSGDGAEWVHNHLQQGGNLSTVVRVRLTPLNGLEDGIQVYAGCPSDIVRIDERGNPQYIPN